MVAVACAISGMITYESFSVSWYWKWQILGLFVVAILIVVWVLRKLAMDLRGWHESMVDNDSCEWRFCDYVKAIEDANAEESEEAES